MKQNLRSVFHMAVVLLFFANNANSQTVGLISHLSGSEDDGYVLFSPLYGDTTYLIDKCGRLVHSWASAYTPGADVYLLADGSLLRTGNYENPVFSPWNISAGGIIQRFDWNGDLLWQYVISDSTETQDHDICYLPNGHILVAIWEVVSDSEALANGRNPATLPTTVGKNLWSAKIIEIQPEGTDSAIIVWQWRMFDHLIQDFDSTKLNYGVIADHPELMDLNFTDYTYDPTTTKSDWLHFNAITYNPTLDEVMISMHNQSEIYIIDHSTDSIQAESHTGGTHNKGGDFLYRWGNPQVYGRGTAADQKFFQQHDPIWIPNGPYANQIMVFDNGLGRPGGNASSIDIINPPVDSAGNYSLDSGAAYGPDTLSWTYESTPPSAFLSSYMGGAQVLPYGNILICEAMSGDFFEIDSTKSTVWKYINPVNNNVPVVQGTTSLPYNAVYRCTFYQSSYDGFAGVTLPTGTTPIELNPLPYTCNVADELNASNATATTSAIIFPNPAFDQITIQKNNLQNITVLDITGKELLRQNTGNVSLADINVATLPNGLYIVVINGSEYHKIVIQH